MINGEKCGIVRSTILQNIMTASLSSNTLRQKPTSSRNRGRSRDVTASSINRDLSVTSARNSQKSNVSQKSVDQNDRIAPKRHSIA